MTHTEEIILKLRDQFNKVMGAAEKNTKKVRTQTGQLDDQVKRLQKTAIKAFGAFAIGQGIRNIARLGIEMEQTRVAFSTFLGDADKANATIKELNEFSNVTPFTNDQVIKAGKSLLAFGTPVEKLKTQLKAIGDISAGTGKDFNELTTIYGKAQIAGTLYAEDINQLVEAGIPIIGEFAKQLGVNESQVKKLASQGKIGFGELQTAFQNLTSDGGTFFNLMEKQSKTVGGQISTLQGQAQTFGIALGEALLPVIQSVITKVQMLTQWVSLNKNQIASWVPTIAKVIGVIGAVIVAIKAWMFVQTILNFLLTANPIGVIIVAIGALIAVIAIWRKEIIAAIENNTKLGIAIKLMFLPVTLLVYAIKFLYEIIRDWLTTTQKGQKVLTAFTAHLDLLGKAVRAVGDWFSDLPNKAIAAFEVISQKVGGYIDQIIGAFKIVTNPFDAEGRADGLRKFKEGTDKINASAGEIYRKAYQERKAKQIADEKAIESEMSAETGASNPTNNATNTGLGNLLGASNSAKSGVSGGLSTVASSAPKNVTISIEKLVESLNINTTNLREGTAEIREEITKALIAAINDAQIQAT